MPTEHFTREDITGVLLGMILFAPFLLSPGFVLGWLCNLLDFRRQPPVWRLMLSIPFSIAFFPIVNFLVGAYVSWTALWILYGAIALGCVLILILEDRERPSEASPPRWIVWVPVAWAVIVLFSGIDLQWGNRLYPSAVVYDFNVRTAFIDGITRHGLPAINPLFYPDHLVPLRYHYFWFIACSLVHRLGGTLVGPRAALIASDVWCGWGVMATVALYLRFFHRRGDNAIWKRLAWGIALCAIGGLDIIPNFFLHLFYWITGTGWTPVSLEWWNDPVTPFITASLWVAHHVAGLLACLTGFLIAFRASGQPARQRAIASVVAGLAFASSVGLSIYVSLVFAVFMTVWITFLLSRRKFAVAAHLCLAGVAAGLLALPYLGSLQAAGGAGGQFLHFAPRNFYPVNGFLPYFGVESYQIAIVDFLSLPLNYFIETGVSMIAAIILVRRFWRRRRILAEPEQAAACMFATSLLICSFVRSGVINNNDLGWRGSLIAQFILLIWSVDLFRAWWRLQRRAIRVRTGRPHTALARWRRRTLVLLCFGGASVAVDFFLIRATFLLSDTSRTNRPYWMEPFDDDLTKQLANQKAASRIGLRSMAMRQIYSALERKLASGAIVQGNSWLFDDLYHGLYGSGEEVAFSFTCGTEFGGNVAECLGVQFELFPLFNDPTVADGISIDDLCAKHHIDALVVNDIDPVFRSKTSWVWRRNPIFANDMARAFRCGTTAVASTSAPRPTLPQRDASRVVFLPRH